ncbi:MAG: alpha-L-fucosidase [Bacteroidia bacterium]|nr:alpha-L-fucosidase [Bacteroidia bacterium]
MINSPLHKVLLLSLMLFVPTALTAQPEPATSKNQVASWEAMKYGMFIHFNMNTYAGAEYDTGKMPPEAFKPDQLDVDQWIRTARDAGMKYAVLTAKHTGGFCLWDSKVTFKGKEYDYDIASSGYKKDIVALFMESCRKYNIKPALYYCLWDDHNQPISTKDEYFQLTKDHITELVTNYKGLAEIWIDIPGILTKPQRTELYTIAKTHQPDCLVTCNNGFTDGSSLSNFPADITNGERTLPPVAGHNPVREVNGKKYYIPMEVCQTINQNWFWMPGDVTKSVRTLYYWYNETTKRGANLLLDVPPDLSGRIPQNLVDRLMELKKIIDAPDKLPPLESLSGYKPVKASSLIDNRVEYLPEYAVDEDPNTRWVPQLKDTLPTLTVDLGDFKRFNTVIIQEPYTAHIQEFEIQYLQGDEWKAIFKGNGIGSNYSRQFPAVESRMVRLVIRKFITSENPFNVISFPNTPPPEEGATIAEFQVFSADMDDADYLNSFQTGREYFFLRSGKAKLIIQADKTGMGPAFTYMLFDAENPAQTGSKKNALNYIPGTNFSHTALKVVLGTVEFSALGHNSEAKWITKNNSPAVELSWWAGGIRVQETFAPAEQPGNFSRAIELTNSDLAGNDTIRIAALNGLPESDPIPIKKGQTIFLNREVQTPSILTSLTPLTPLTPLTSLTSLTTSDSLVQSLFRNASYALPGMVSANGRMDAGVFEYGNQWVRDGSNVAMGLIYSGAFESAKGLLTYILSDLVSDEGTTVIAGGFDEPDREEFDQMGVLMNCLKLYYDWTGENSLLTTWHKKIIALVERPLNPVFRDSTGMVHNKREFWERTFSDAYELAYQTYMIQGLRDAADLAGILGVPEKADSWRKQSDVFLTAMLDHPTRSLVDQGALIKRRNVNGEIADLTVGRQVSYKNDAPVPTEYSHRLNPDATYALPIMLGIIDPHSSLAKKSLDKLEAIWNARWITGGYERYHSSSQIDQPGPWTFGTAFIARAQHDAGLLDRSRRSLQWLYNIQGGNAGAWFEEIPLNRSQIPWCGIVPWTSAEVTSFVVRHWLGVSVSGDYVTIKPNFYPGTKTVSADLRFRSERLKITIDQSGRRRIVTVNGQSIIVNRSSEYKIFISK